MSRLARFTIPLVFLFAATARAQDAEPKPQQTSTADTSAKPAATSPAMTPREVAEMRADIMMARKEYLVAIGAYMQIEKKEPKNPELLNKIGVAYQQLGELNRASRFYKNAIKTDKSFASPVNNLGTVEYEKKHYGKAINLYKRALDLRIDQSTIFSNLGYAYFGNKEYPKAMDSFGKALAIDPGIFERKGGAGSVVQQRTTTDPGLFYFFVAKSFAQAGDAVHAAHYLKLARDDDYKDFLSAQTDPAFAKVIKDPLVQEVLQVPPSYADGKKPQSN